MAEIERQEWRGEREKGKNLPTLPAISERAFRHIFTAASQGKVARLNEFLMAKPDSHSTYPCNKNLFE